ncbi:hypothetical protein BACCIP111895_01277 [Neobacillus rhizosphaerae]|uniref:Uncharacterized protein n=1 Tax=Neobacillus rhizosphaerae TaxID=2880965 RepID=A0ABN8KL22_9BACI|nr:hypothetical protein BACCIP111895_01277 [Neobacillus rhizosphaerae]
MVKMGQLSVVPFNKHAIISNDYLKFYPISTFYLKRNKIVTICPAFSAAAYSGPFSHYSGIHV